MAGNENTSAFPAVVELNVGGVFYSTTLSTLKKDKDSLLANMFSAQSPTSISELPVVKDSKGKYFIDRDGVLFRYILDYLRNQKMVLPENFHEKERLKQEAEFYKLPNMVKCINAGPPPKPSQLPPLPNQSSPSAVNSLTPTSNTGDPGCITLGYRGTFAFGRDGLADVKFRKLSRILVSGRVSLCREVFKDTLNESRDPDRGTTDRYTSRFFLKHTFLEQALDMLQEAGFVLTGSCGSGTNSAGEIKPGMESEESKWNHYNEFVFIRS